MAQKFFAYSIDVPMVASELTKCTYFAQQQGSLDDKIMKRTVAVAARRIDKKEILNPILYLCIFSEQIFELKKISLRISS